MVNFKIFIKHLEVFFFIVRMFRNGHYSQERLLFASSAERPLNHILQKFQIKNSFFRLVLKKIHLLNDAAPYFMNRFLQALVILHKTHPFLSFPFLFIKWTCFPNIFGIRECNALSKIFCVIKFIVHMEQYTFGIIVK